MKELIAFLLVMIVILIIYGRKSTERFTTSTSADNQYIQFYANLKTGYLTIGGEGVKKNIVLIKKVDNLNINVDGDLIINNIKTTNEPLLIQDNITDTFNLDLTSHEGEEHKVKLLENKVKNEFSVRLNEKMQGYYIVIVHLPKKSKITIKTSEDTTITKPIVSTLSKEEIAGLKDVQFDLRLTEIVYDLIRQQKFKTSEMHESKSTKQTSTSKASTGVEETARMGKSKSDSFDNRDSDDHFRLGMQHFAAARIKTFEEAHRKMHENM